MRTKRKFVTIVLQFFAGAFGSFVLLMFRDLPPLPGLGHNLSHWWLGIIFVITGGITTAIFQAGDDSVGRAFIFGLTWPPLIASITR